MTARRVAAAILALVLLAAPAFAAAQRVTIQSSAAQTATGNSTAFLLSTAAHGVAYLNVTAASGTSPTLNLWLQGSNDDGTTWFDIAADVVFQSNDASATNPTATANSRNFNASTNITAAGKWVAVYKTLPYKHVRAKWIIGGTSPSFTFSVILDVK